MRHAAARPAPVSRAWGLSRAKGLGASGIGTPAQPATQDPFAVHVRLKASQQGVSPNLLHALIGAVEGSDWREVACEDLSPFVSRLGETGCRSGRSGLHTRRRGCRWHEPAFRDGSAVPVQGRPAPGATSPVTAEACATAATA